MRRQLRCRRLSSRCGVLWYPQSRRVLGCCRAVQCRRGRSAGYRLCTVFPALANSLRRAVQSSRVCRSRAALGWLSSRRCSIQKPALQQTAQSASMQSTGPVLFSSNVSRLPVSAVPLNALLKAAVLLQPPLYKGGEVAPERSRG